jgi:hypothetical protein
MWSAFLRVCDTCLFSALFLLVINELPFKFRPDANLSSSKLAAAYYQSNTTPAATRPIR